MAVAGASGYSRRMRVGEAVVAIEENLVATWAGFARLPRAEVYEGPDLMRLLTGEPYAVSNGIYRARFDTDRADDAIERAIEPFRARRLPFSWLVGPGSEPADLGARLEAHDLRFLGDWPGMAVDLDDFDDPIASSGGGSPDLPEGVTIERVTTRAALAEWGAVFEQGFAMPAGVGRFFRRAFVHIGLGDDSPLRHFLVRIDGRPAACSSLSLTAGVAGVYNVATVPAARQRGLGSIVSLWPLHLARTAGRRLAILHATEMAVNVYRRLGFREHCRIRQYQWDPPEEERPEGGR